MCPLLTQLYTVTQLLCLDADIAVGLQCQHPMNLQRSMRSSHQDLEITFVDLRLH